MTRTPPEPIRDLTDDEARRALVCKWGSVGEHELPAWVAEMDYALAPPVLSAVQEALAGGMTGYPRFGAGGALGSAYAGFARRHHGWTVDPEQVIAVSDVTAGIRLALDVLSDPAPVVLPTPAYPPQLDVPGVTGRDLVTVALDPDAPEAALDLDGIDRALAAGARTVLLTQPHNPLGRAYRRSELEGLRDVVTAHGARVVSDEIHAPLVLPGAEHVPYLSIPGTGSHAVAVVAASKAFNTAGLRCAQIVTADTATRDRLLDVPMVRNDSWSPLGVVAAEAAYTHGDRWLASLIARLDELRTLLGGLLADHLPDARMRPLEATYLAWLDLRSYGHRDPAAVIRERGGVVLAPGHDYAPGLDGHVRLNIATSPDRLTEIVRRMSTLIEIKGRGSQRAPQRPLTPTTPGGSLSGVTAGRGSRRPDVTTVEMVGGIEKRDLVLVDHDPRWAEEYAEHERRIRAALGPAAIQVEHIGSTSVPGLAAKPIIDVLVTVEDITAEEDHVDQLVGAGYELRVREPGHRLVRTPARDVHVHVLEVGDVAADDYLLFRDRLRADAQDRELYERTKRALVTQDWADMNAYADAKTAVITGIKERARASRP